MTTNRYPTLASTPAPAAFPSPSPSSHPSPLPPPLYINARYRARGCLNASYRIYCFTADANRRELLSHCINVCRNVQQMPNFERGNFSSMRADRSLGHIIGISKPPWFRSAETEIVPLDLFNKLTHAEYLSAFETWKIEFYQNYSDFDSSAICLIYNIIIRQYNYISLSFIRYR